MLGWAILGQEFFRAGTVDYCIAYIGRQHCGKLARVQSSWRLNVLPIARSILIAAAAFLAAGNACALTKEAQEFLNIQTKIAPEQCELQKLSAQAAAAQRAGDQGKRQELVAQMEPIAKRIQTYQPRMQELARYVQSTSPDYQTVMQQTMELRAKCKP